MFHEIAPEAACVNCDYYQLPWACFLDQRQVLIRYILQILPVLCVFITVCLFFCWILIPSTDTDNFNLQAADVGGVSSPDLRHECVINMLQ